MNTKFIGAKPTPEVRAFVRWLEDQLGVTRPVSLDLWDDNPHGCFYPTLNTPLIIARVNGGLLDTIAHEYAHHEQLRRTKRLYETGVSQRAAALVRRWRREG